jgi:hypothetical protein
MSEQGMSRKGIVSLVGRIEQVPSMLWGSRKRDYQPWVHEYLLQGEFALTRIGQNLHLLMPTNKGVNILVLQGAANEAYVSGFLREWADPTDNLANFLASWLAANGCLPIDAAYTARVQRMIADYRSRHMLPDRSVELFIK